MIPCEHKAGRWESPGRDWDGDPLPDEWVEYSTTEDIDAHRYRCTQCGEVLYYSGAARRFYEDGVYSDVLGPITGE